MNLKKDNVWVGYSFTSAAARRFPVLLEAERQRLIRVVKTYGLNSPQSLKQSQRLDILVLAEMKRSVQNDVLPMRKYG